MPDLHQSAAAALAFALALTAGCGSQAGARDQAGPAGVGACADVRIPGAGCTMVAVRENRAAPDGRRIQLRVVTLPARARDRAPDPLFVLAGGPGQAATDLAGTPFYAHPAIRRRDVVFVDQRGTGGSNGLLCRFYGPDAQAYFDRFLPLDRVRACRDALTSRADLAQYTTAASVDDLEEVRIALGYDRINLMGGSYGTRLALEYLRRHERRVRAVVLEGAVPPGMHVPERFGALAQRALDRLLDECARDAACTGRFGDARANARAVFAGLRAGPVRTAVTLPDGKTDATVTFTRDHAGEAIRYLSYTARGAQRIPFVLAEAAAGNFRPIAQFLLDWRSAGTFEALYLSITCAEDVPFVAPSAAEQDDSTYLGGYRVREGRAACAEWPRGAVPEWHGQPVRSVVPALIVSGDLDPVTPPEAGDAVASMLVNSLHLRVPFGGHSPHGLEGLECLDGIIRTFLERGTAAGLDTACVAREIRRPGFAES
jgi:pimeloyl-ACP methyl ester carboxylesterase